MRGPLPPRSVLRPSAGIAVCLNSLLNFLRDFISSLSPFNDFQGLTGCLKNGVHSSAPGNVSWKVCVSSEVTPSEPGEFSACFLARHLLYHINIRKQ